MAIMRILLRRGTAAEWTAANPILGNGEPGLETDTGLQKIGNGTAAWAALAYANQGPQGIQGIQGIQGVQGVKGDPGGIVLGTQLLTNDLNTITTSGVYRQDNSANATLVRNYPVTAPGVMVVLERSTGSLTQEYSPITGTVTFEARVTYNRVLQGGVWSPWRVQSTHRVDQAAGRAIYHWDDLNNREQLVYGDTGNRRIETTQAMLNGWTAPEQFHLRRVGLLVYVGLYNMNGSAATATTFTNLPVGFRPSYGSQNFYARRATTNDWLIATSGGDLSIAVGAICFNAAVQTFSWITNDAWPAALPGVASGTIPNL